MRVPLHPPRDSIPVGCLLSLLRTILQLLWAALLLIVESATFFRGPNGSNFTWMHLGVQCTTPIPLWASSYPVTGCAAVWNPAPSPQVKLTLRCQLYSEPPQHLAVLLEWNPCSASPHLSSLPTPLQYLQPTPPASAWGAMQSLPDAISWRVS